MLTDQMIVEKLFGPDVARGALEHIRKQVPTLFQFGDYQIRFDITSYRIPYYVCVYKDGKELGVIHVMENPRTKTVGIWRALAHLAMNGFSETDGLAHSVYGRCVGLVSVPKKEGKL